MLRWQTGRERWRPEVEALRGFVFSGFMSWSILTLRSILIMFMEAIIR